MSESLNANLENLGFAAIGPLASSRDVVFVRCLRCSKEFEAPYGKLRSGTRKCECAAIQRKLKAFHLNLQSLSAIARSKGGLVLTNEPKTLREKWLFQCQVMHTWSAQGGSVKAGTWCPQCAGNFQRSIEDLQAIVVSRGGQLLTQDYKGVDATYTFRCNLGHQFENMFKKVEQGQWCPTCGKSSKSEEIARATFEQLFQVPFRKVRPTWLRNSRGRIMEIDGYSPELEIGFEYQGIQHFQAIGIYSQDIELRVQDDERKFQLCAEHGIRLFYLTHTDAYEDFPRRIQEQAATFGIDVSHIDFAQEVDLSSAYIRTDRLQELRALLEPKKIRVLSKKWLTSNAKYSLECLVCGHKWQAVGNSFFNSRRVAGCRICALKAVAGANRGAIRDLQDFAESFHGKLLSKEYVQRRWVYDWECKQGHKFEGNFNNMKFRNEFCPACEGRVTKLFVTEDEAVNLFIDSGLEILGEYTGKRDWISVKCRACGAVGQQKYQNLREGMVPCRACDTAAKAARALEIMLEAGARPIEPFRSSTSKWLCECLKCHSRITPSLTNVKRGQGACIYCGRQKLRK